MSEPLKFFLCSTYSDLALERNEVLESLTIMRQRHRSMELFGARDNPPIDTCLEEVQQSDILVIIVGFMYGSLTPELNISYTEAEYSEGVRLGKGCLVYMKHEDASTLRKFVEQDSEKMELLKIFCEKLNREHTIKKFQNDTDLVKLVMADVSHLLVEQEKNKYTSSMVSQIVEDTLGSAIDQAQSSGLGMLSTPYHRPFQYLGMPSAKVADIVNGSFNAGGNIVVTSDIAGMFLEIEGNFVSYVEVELKESKPCDQNEGFNSKAALGALSINPSELELVRNQNHCHTYYDHRRKIKVSVACDYDGAFLCVRFGTKYYGM